MASENLALSLSRWYAARVDTVFRAFSEPALLEQWFSPSPEMRLEILQHELRVGGRYRFRYHLPEGGCSVVSGEFCEISPPKRLVFTWTWEPPDEHAGVQTQVAIELRADAGGTSVAVAHERFPALPVRERHHSGWDGTLARLAALL